MSDDRVPSGVARYMGTLPNTPRGVLSLFDVGDLELYRVSPPLAGYHVVAAAKTLWAMRMRSTLAGEADDPVSTTFFGVDGGEGARVDRDRQLFEPVDGRGPARALEALGYSVR